MGAERSDCSGVQYLWERIGVTAVGCNICGMKRSGANELELLRLAQCVLCSFLCLFVCSEQIFRVTAVGWNIVL